MQTVGAALARCRPHVPLGAAAIGLLLAPSPSLALPAALILAAALALARAPATGAMAAAVVVAATLAGAGRLEAIDGAAARAPIGAAVYADAVVLERPRPTRFGSRAPLRVIDGAAAGAPVMARAGSSLHWPRDTRPGAIVAVRGRVRRPPARGPGAAGYRAHLRRRGIAAELRLVRVTATGRRRGGLAGALDAVRGRAENAIEAGLPPPAAALLRGMVLGQDERIDELTRDDWRRSGLAHLLAVSGQNVMLLGALALPLLVAAGAGRRARIAALLALIAVYVPLAGAGPSLQRAGVMGAAGLAALAASRPASRVHALLLAAVVTLALDPRAASDPGWQLSFAAVAGILALAPPIRAALRGLPRGVADAIAITVAATVATAPLLTHHFGSAPLVGLPANLLAAPAVAPVMWAGMVAIALAAVAPLAPPAAALATGAAAVARPPLAYLEALAGWFAALPVGEIRPPAGSAAAVAVSYALLAAAVLALRRLARRAAPRAQAAAAGWRRLRRRTRAAIAAGALAGLILTAARVAAPPPPDRPTVSFLDVGQGDATLIQAPVGAAVLFDGGPPEARVERLLRRAGVRRLAAVVATHPSRDHHGGLAAVLAAYPVDLLLDGGDGTRDPAFRRVLDTARRRGIRVATARPPLSIHAGAIAIRILSPPPRGPGPPPSDPNPRGVVALVRIGGFTLMLSADAESEALLPLRLPRVDAIKVPHHGSADPGLPRVLARLRPSVAAIEVGRGNVYGHPAPATLAALRRAGARIYRTDDDGTVRLTLEGGHVRVETER